MAPKKHITDAEKPMVQPSCRVDQSRVPQISVTSLSSAWAFAPWCTVKTEGTSPRNKQGDSNELDYIHDSIWLVVQ